MVQKRTNMNSKTHYNILKKFGYSSNLIEEYKYWLWLLRPEQITLGSSILITKEHYCNYSDLPKSCFEEFEIVVKNVESVLKSTFDYDRINYLMLMMNDPSVHYHVIPRYNNEKIFIDKSFKDVGFPGVADLSYINITTLQERNEIINELKKK